eukprot:435407-Alexandrium_andersonii.AAC.1
MVPEPTDASDGLIYGVVAQASLAQHLDHQHRQSGVAGVFGEEALIHCSPRHITCTSGGTRARQIGHSA